MACAHQAGAAEPVDRPVMNYGINAAKAADYEQAAGALMGLSEQEVLGLVPPHGYVSFCECPSCYGGAQGRGIFTWERENPDQLTCKYCGTVAYPNPAYPENEVLRGRNALGEEVSLPYYRNPENGAKHFFSMHLWLYKRGWLLNHSDAVAKAYVVTGKEDYARRAVLVLDGFAQAYPHYPALHNRHSRNVSFCDPQEPPFAWNAGRWGYFHSEIPKPIIAIYDMVYNSPAFERLSAERGYDVRAALENDFLRETYRIAAASLYHVGNVVGYDVAGVATLGRVIGEPDYVHQAFGWMVDNIEQGFFRDGLWHESPSYHYMTVSGLRGAFGAVRGHTDPPGYRYGPTGQRMDNFNPEKDVPFYGKIQKAPQILNFPNGMSTPVHDTWAGQRSAAARSETVSTIAPAYGHASLGRGQGSDQLQAQLHFGGTYGHHHLDCLNLTLFAKEHEMLSDLGYTWTHMRAWTVATSAHNTVVVDMSNQLAGRHKVDGSLLRYFPGAAEVSLVEAEGPDVYPGLEGIDAYRRLLLVVPVNEKDAYVIDVFRVRGGSTHDWTIHGDADVDTTARCSLPLPGTRQYMLEPGVEWTPPTSAQNRYEPYGMIQDLRHGAADGVFWSEFAYPGDEPRGVRSHIWAGEAEVFLGRSPSVRRTGVGSRADMRKAFDYWMPHLVVRRQGAGPLRSTFAAVHEPYSGRRFVERVEYLPAAGGGPADIALRITHAAGVDTVICISDPASLSAPVTAGDVAMQGLCAVVRQERPGGPVLRAHLFEGEAVRCGDLSLTSPTAAISGVITGTARRLDGAPHNSFTVEAQLPEGVNLAGNWMIVEHPDGKTSGHPIEGVEQDNERIRILLADDHGLRQTGETVKEVYFPQRTFAGPMRFRIPLTVSLVAAQTPTAAAAP